jgi:hypothetical protein
MEHPKRPRLREWEKRLLEKFPEMLQDAIRTDAEEAALECRVYLVKRGMEVMCGGDPVLIPWKAFIRDQFIEFSEDADEFAEILEKLGKRFRKLAVTMRKKESL